MAGLAFIHNIADLVTWDGTSAYPKPRFTWSFTDADGGAQSAFQVRVYADSGGVAGSLLYTSGKQVSAASFWDSSTAGIYATQYWWSVELWDSFDESSGESSKTSFKMRFGQAIYEFHPTTWANQMFTSAALPANTQKAILFRGATAANGVGAGAWKANIGDVDSLSYGWLNVLVRLATQTSGTQPALSDMTLTYTGSTNIPDHWTYTGGSWILDSSNYRYGSRAFKCIVASNVDVPEIYPYRFVVGDDVFVQANTDYVFSAYVRVDPSNAFGASSSLRLAIYAGGSNTTLLAGGVVGQSYGDGATVSTVDASEGWQRLILTYRTDNAETLIRPKIQYVNGGAGSGDVFWVDAVKFEPGTVASQWAPGWISSAITMDSYGIAIDGSGGATFRLRNVAGTKDVELDQIVTVVDAGVVDVATMPGYEYYYAERTSNMDVTSLDPTLTTVFAGASVAYDGEPVMVTFWTPYLAMNVADSSCYPYIIVDGDAVGCGFMNIGTTTEANSLTISRRLALSAGSHTIGISASVWGTSASAKIAGGTGETIADYAPCFLRITKV